MDQSFTHPRGEHVAGSGVPMSELPLTMEIALDAISPSPFNPRKNFDHVDELAASIKEQGLLENLVVRPAKAKGKFELIAGECRLRALKKLKAKTAPCRVLAGADEATARAAQITENLHRQDIGVLEEAEAFKALQDLEPKKWTAMAIAKTIGKTDRFVQQRLTIARGLTAELKKDLEKGDINVETARVAATFPADIQRQIPDYAFEHGPDRVKREAYALSVPESAAKFDIALYKGDWLEADKRRYFADTAQFRKLQRAPAEKKLAEVQKEWPKAELVDLEVARHLYWADTDYIYSNSAITERARDGDTPAAFKVPKDKCRAVVWIAGNGEIRKALGVCSKATVEAAYNERQRKARERYNKPAAKSDAEKPAHRKERVAFNGAVRAAIARKPDHLARWQLWRMVADDKYANSSALGYHELKKVAPAPLRKFRLGWSGSESEKIKIWQAILKMPIGQVRAGIATLTAAELENVEWAMHEWKRRPTLLVAIADGVGVKAPAIALPPPPKAKPEAKYKWPPSKAAKCAGKAKADKARAAAKAKTRKHQ